MSPTSRRVTLAVIFLLIAVACARLGLWQVSRLKERRAANAAALAARALPPVPLGGARFPDSTLVERRVVAEGRYDHGHEVVLRGEAYQGVPGVHVVTPLMLAGSDTAVLVNRGFVPAPDAATALLVDSLREPGKVRVEGIALPVPSDGSGGKPIVRAGHTTWGRLDLAALRDSLPYPVLGIYVRQTPDGAALPSSRPTSLSARFPRHLDPPPLDDGPHLSYAIQWFGFAVLACAFAGVVVLRGGGQ
jgi:surfeit locus 1 family protein